jgi:hypothetical protein
MRFLQVSMAVLLAAGVASAEIIDIGPFGANAYDVGGEEGSDIYAQAFIAPEENVFVLGGMYLFGGGLDPPAIRMDLWGTDAAGDPDENNVLIAGPVYQQSFPVLTLVTVEGNVELVPGQRYFLVLNAMIDQEGQNSYASSWSNPNDVYPGGWATWSNDLAATWSNPDGEDWRWDFAFYVETVTAGCAGDVDADGDTDLADLAALLAAYGSAIGDPDYDPQADFDDDEDVDLTDLAFLLADYGCGT